MENENAFKNWINPKVVQLIAKEISYVYPEFNSKEFLKLSPALNQLELKARVLLITENLKLHLPHDYVKSLAIIRQVIVAEKLNSFELWPFSEFIGQFGLDHFPGQT